MMNRCDYHPCFPQRALLDSETGELRERRLAHREEAEGFYRDLGHGMKARVGMEASGQARLPRPEPSGYGSRKRIARMPNCYAAVAGRSLSTDLGDERRESRPSVIAVAPALDGANAHASDG